MLKAKIIWIQCLMTLFLMIAAMSCGNNKSNSKNPNNSRNKSVESTTKKSSSSINPLTIDSSKVITVDQLTKSFFSVKGKTVTFVGYVNFFFDKGKFKGNDAFTAKPGDKKKLVECSSMVKYDTDEFSRNTPVVIRGTIDKLPKEAFKNYDLKTIRLSKCDVISKGKASNTVPADYNNIDKGIMKIEDLHKAYYAWISKSISVTGYYYATTTSTTTFGKTVRIDLKSPNKSSKVKVGFKMKKGYTSKKIEKRDGVIIKGKVAGETFGNVQLKDSELMNR